MVYRYESRIFVAAADKEGSWAAAALPLPLKPDKSPWPVADFAPLDGTDILGVVLENGSIIACHVEDMKIVKLFPSVFPEKVPPRMVRWRNPKCLTAIGGRIVVEADPATRGSRQADLWQLPSAAMSFCWLGDDRFAMVTETGKQVPALVSGVRGSRRLGAGIDIGNKLIDRLEWLGSAGTLAAYGRDGSIRLYKPKDMSAH